MWLEDEEEIILEAIDHFQQQFKQGRDVTNFPLINQIPESIYAEDNEVLCKLPDFEEVRSAVFSLSGDSASGPNGLTGRFYQHCWDILEEDIHRTVLEFFEGNTLPKSFTHTNLVLIPKKVNF